jgi:DNA polymerase-3 subunit epsilon
MLQLTKPLAFIDIEATGTNVATDRIVEIAIIKNLPDGNRTVKRKLLNPQMPIPQVCVDIHGITDDMVKDAPTFKAVAHELKQVLGWLRSFLLQRLPAGYSHAGRRIYSCRCGVRYEGRKLMDVQKIFHQMEQRTLAAAYKFYCQKSLEGRPWR